METKTPATPEKRALDSLQFEGLLKKIESGVDALAELARFASPQSQLLTRLEREKLKISLEFLGRVAFSLSQKISEKK